MRPLKTDLTAFKKLNLDKTPVGVKYLFHKPEGVEPLGKQMALCEMLGESYRRGTPFYFTAENEACVGKMPLGMEELAPFAEAGQIGEGLGIFQEPRANRRLYQIFPKLTKGSVNYVVFAPLEKITFEPDVLVINAEPAQAEIVMRAMTYATGEPYESKMTIVLGCAWLFVYPYISGKVNYMMTGLGWGMKAKHVFPAGRVLISIPYNWLAAIVGSLEEMEWEPVAFTEGRDKYMERERRVFNQMTQNTGNP